MNKLISIITVVYNDIDNIERTINSVISQKRELIEYIVIDGNSKDGTKELLTKYEDSIDILISEPDKGIYDAMNKGIKLASGKYILFMNSGDNFYHNDIVNSIFNEDVLLKDYDVIYGDVNVVSDNYASIVKGSKPSKLNPMSFNHQAVFVRTQLMKVHPFDTKYKICADKNFFATIYDDNTMYYYADTVISEITAIGFSNSNRVKNLKEVKNIKREHGLPMGNINVNLAKAYMVDFVEKVFGLGLIEKLREIKHRKQL